MPGVPINLSVILRLRRIEQVAADLAREMERGDSESQTAVQMAESIKADIEVTIQSLGSTMKRRRG